MISQKSCKALTFNRCQFGIGLKKVISVTDPSAVTCLSVETAVGIKSPTRRKTETTIIFIRYPPVTAL